MPGRGEFDYFKSWVTYADRLPEQLYSLHDLHHPAMTPAYHRAQSQLRKHVGVGNLWFTGQLHPGRRFARERAALSHRSGASPQPELGESTNVGEVVAFASAVQMHQQRWELMPRRLRLLLGNRRRDQNSEPGSTFICPLLTLTASRRRSSV